jgi:hypothetical protein
MTKTRGSEKKKTTVKDVGGVGNNDADILAVINKKN